MAIDPTELDQTDKQHLVELVEKTGDEALREAVNAYLERAAKESESNGLSDAEHDREQTEEEADGLDTVCIQWCTEQLQGQPPPSLEEVRQELSTIKGSLAAEIIAERDES
jgi:hypothetical protein